MRVSVSLTLGRVMVLQFQSTKEKALATLGTMSSAQIVSASALQRTGGMHMPHNLGPHHPGMRPSPYPQPPHPGGWSPAHGPVSQSVEYVSNCGPPM